MVWHHHDTTIRQLLLRERLKNILEIGIHKGEHTFMLMEIVDELDGRMTCVDPVVRRRVSWRLGKNPRVRFLTKPSLEALPVLQAEGARYDCAVVDGDHNWYTVFHELEALRGLVEPRGVIFLHDVAWPYGRRDMYYAPERIPAEFRHPYAHRGIVAGRSTLAPEGAAKKAAVNADVCNALEEGGPRNGVLTAVEDFIAAHPEEGWRVEVIEHYNGLGVLRRA